MATKVHYGSRRYRTLLRSLKHARGELVLLRGAPDAVLAGLTTNLAADLGRPLYRIDLSDPASRFIGETEKNLANVLDRASGVGAVLFFDEADTLFAKRGTVKDSHDRYANQEISYLLDRMDSYDGLIIVAVDRKSNLDSAFLRRTRHIVEFREPELPP